VPEGEDFKTDEFAIPGPEDIAPRPTGATVRADFAAASHPGRVRPNNEDHYFYCLGRSCGPIFNGAS